MRPGTATRLSRASTRVARALALAALVPGALAAQSRAGAPRQTLSTNPLAVPFGLVSAEWERAVGERGFSVGVGGFTTFTRDNAVVTDGGSEALRSVQAKLKFYPDANGLRGFAVGLTAGVAHERKFLSGGATIDERGREVWSFRETTARTAPTLGATLDYNFLLGRQRRFLLGLGLGVRRPLGTSQDFGALRDPLLDSRLQIGYAF